MIGPLGEIHGKGGVPELEAVASLTIAALQARLLKRGDEMKCSLQLWHIGRAGEWGALVEVDGIEGAGSGTDAETAILQALGNLPEALR